MTDAERLEEDETEARIHCSAIRTFSWTVKHPGIKGDAVVLPAKDWDYLIDKGVGLAIARAQVERLRVVIGEMEAQRVLRDQSVIVGQDGAVFEQIAKWAKAPTNTASASLAALEGKRDG